MRLAGASYQQIADELGYTSRGAACQDISRALEQAVAEQTRSVESYREEELQRLDALLAEAIFGREPALIVSAIGSVVTLLVALNLPGLSAGAGAAITAFLTAVIIAVTTRPVAPALFTGVVAAGAALVSAYGLHVSDAVVGAVSAVVLAGFALFGIRPQVSPAASQRLR